jgi:predicted O-methyltransferase YrrM
MSDHRRRLAGITRLQSQGPPGIVLRVIATEAVTNYLEELRPAPDPVLAEMEAHGARDGIPIVHPPTGQLLELLARVCGARRIVEVGTAIGVSTLYLARGVADGGTVISFEIDPERHAAARDYMARAGVGDRVDLRLKDAREGLAELEAESFDMAFIDGTKLEYGDYLEGLVPLLASGAVLAVDNVLMSGTVAENRTDGHWTDDQIAMARAFNERLVNDERLSATVTPVGDGVLLAVVN